MNLFTEIQRHLEAGRRVALVTVIRAEGSSPRSVGAHMLVHPDGSIQGTIGGGTVEHRVIERALEVLRKGAADIYRVHLTRDLGMCCGGAMEFFIEPLEQDPTLVLFGAGHVARELCRIAAMTGFKVIVIDEREEFATLERFPDAAELVVDDPLAVLSRLPYGPLSYFVIITHQHRLDEDLLRLLAPREYRYLGMIGSRAKVARFLERLRARGVAEEALSRVHMPIGLSIGATTPAEIAVSIMAELIQLRRNGGSLAEPAPPLNWRAESTARALRASSHALPSPDDALESTDEDQP